MNNEACFVWDYSPVLFSIGPLKIHWYSVMFATFIVLAYFMIRWQFRRTNLSDEMTDRFSLYLILGLFLGAYFGHRIFYRWDVFFTDPLSTMTFKGGIRGLSSHGASTGMLIAAFLFHLRTKLRYVELLDRMLISVPLACFFVRIGNLMNSGIVGRKTDVAWAFCFPRYDGMSSMIPRHPSQLYEAAIGLFVLGVVVLTDRLAGGEKRPVGLIAGVFAASYFGLRFVVEFFKERHVLSPHIPLTMGQFLSIPFTMAGILLVIWALKTRLPAGLPPKAGGIGGRVTALN